MFDEDPEKSLDRPHECAVNHDGLMMLAILARVGEVEPLGIVEVDLNGGALPRSAENILNLDVDFGAIKHAFTRVDLVRHPASFERPFQGVGRQGPVLVGADRFFGAGREIDFELREAERAKNEKREVQYPTHFRLDLVRAAE